MQPFCARNTRKACRAPFYSPCTGRSAGGPAGAHRAQQLLEPLVASSVRGPCRAAATAAARGRSALRLAPCRHVRPELHRLRACCGSRRPAQQPAKQLTTTEVSRHACEQRLASAAHKRGQHSCALAGLVEPRWRQLRGHALGAPLAELGPAPAAPRELASLKLPAAAQNTASVPSVQQGTKCLLKQLCEEQSVNTSIGSSEE